MNGLVSIDEPLENEQFADIAVKALIEYESDLSKKDKQRIIDSKISLSNHSLQNSEDIEIQVDSKKTLDITLEEKTNGEILVKTQ